MSKSFRFQETMELKHRIIDTNFLQRPKHNTRMKGSARYTFLLQHFYDSCLPIYIHIQLPKLNKREGSRNLNTIIHSITHRTRFTAYNITQNLYIFYKQYIRTNLPTNLLFRGTVDGSVFDSPPTTTSPAPPRISRG